jgi:hypothetical protein
MGPATGGRGAVKQGAPSEAVAFLHDAWTAMIDAFDINSHVCLMHVQV